MQSRKVATKTGRAALLPPGPFYCCPVNLWFAAGVVHHYSTTTRKVLLLCSTHMEHSTLRPNRKAACAFEKVPKTHAHLLFGEAKSATSADLAPVAAPTVGHTASVVAKGARVAD